jgi:hypothetical protein
VLKRLPLLLGFIVTAGALAGCGAAVYQPSKNTSFELDPSAEINDDDVRKAFEARPQMRDKVQVAYYSFDPARAEPIEAMLKALPGVSGTYRIPSLLATGQRRNEERNAWAPPLQFSMKKLRLLAARAHCDLLVVFDYGNKVDTSANGLAAFNLLLVPALFLPFLDVRVQSHMDAFVLDTRNGYLYAHVDAQKHDAEDFVTIYSSSGDKLIDAQWPHVLKDTAEAVRKVLESERARPAAQLAQPPAPAAPASSGEVPAAPGAPHKLW